jgi:hypothetical protein
MPGVEMGSSEQQRAAESPSPSAFAALNGKGTAPPAAKKPKLTFAEQEFKRVQYRRRLPTDRGATSILEADVLVYAMLPLPNL